MYRIAVALIISVVLFLNSSFVGSENEMSKMADDPEFIYESTSWVDSLMNSMTLDEKIGQLFMVAAYSNQGKAHIDKITHLIMKYKIGGLIFFQGGPERQVNLIHHYQGLSKVPLLIGFDGEWGLGMRLDSTISFPRQMTLGAIQNDRVIYDMGVEIARQCSITGIHVNFAPVIDINNNPKNPVIGRRSFGENKHNVARKGYQYMRGLQDYKIIATGKHFPGHGDTDKDSHKTLPLVNHHYDRLDSLELYPFKQLINAGLSGMMVAHISIPQIEPRKNYATTLSHKVVTDILQDSLGFKGLIFTDALNMKGVADYFAPGEVDKLAFLAGNDVLLYPKNVPIAIEKLRKTIGKKKVYKEMLDKKVRKILLAKKWVGVSEYETLSKYNLDSILNTPKAKALNRKLFAEALTLIKNDNDLVPFKTLDTLNFASLSIGSDTLTPFQSLLNNYVRMPSMQINKSISNIAKQQLLDTLSKFNTVFIGIHSTSRSPYKKYGITESTLSFVSELSKHTNVVLSIFAVPYSLNQFDLSNTNSVLVGYEDNSDAQEMAAQALFGGLSITGKLPVSSGGFSEGDGIDILEPIRLSYGIPEAVKMNSGILNEIDSIALDAIEYGATPGCQVLVAKDNKVVFHKSYGYHTYDNEQPVTNSDLYDVASITKITASVPCIMRMFEAGQISLDSALSKYLPYLDTTNKKDLIIKDILTHQSRLKDWIPFYLKSIATEEIRDTNYSTQYSERYSVKVADSMYIIPSFRDTMYWRIADSDLNKKDGYKYSDLGYYLFHQLIEQIYNDSLQNVVNDIFYKPLGANSTGYNPLKRFDRELTVPTQLDDRFRNQLVHGYVHDYGSAMLGGVCGHAGIFSNTNDIAKIMQMYLNGGIYGGKRYFKSKTIKTFSGCPNCPDNRRGIGFDKAEKNPRKLGPTCDYASAESFGHTGFTGCITWVDPANNTVYVFLSNRIHPDQENKKYIKIHVRTHIQEKIYEAIEGAL